MQRGFYLDIFIIVTEFFIPRLMVLIAINLLILTLTMIFFFFTFLFFIFLLSGIGLFRQWPKPQIKYNKLYLFVL